MGQRATILTAIFRGINGGSCTWCPSKRRWSRCRRHAAVMCACFYRRVPLWFVLAVVVRTRGAATFYRGICVLLHFRSSLTPLLERIKKIPYGVLTLGGK